MSGFWSTETLQVKIPALNLIEPYEVDNVVNCSYELCLGAEAYVTGQDPKTKRLLQPGEQLRIPPGQFANLLTEETVRVPEDALGLISAKFKWKQRGLVNVSGFHVDPGYSGRILFSVFNAGPEPVVVARGDRLFLLWYSSLDQATADTYTKAPRVAISSEDVSNLQGDVASPQALAQRVQALETFMKATLWIAGIVVVALITLWINSTLDGQDSTPGQTDSVEATTSTAPPSTTTTVPTTTKPPSSTTTSQP